MARSELQPRLGRALKPGEWHRDHALPGSETTVLPGHMQQGLTPNAALV